MLKFFDISCLYPLADKVHAIICHFILRFVLPGQKCTVNCMLLLAGHKVVSTHVHCMLLYTGHNIHVCQHFLHIIMLGSQMFI